MNPIQSASDLARNLYASIQKQAAPVGKAVSSAVGNAGNVVQNAIHNAVVKVANTPATSPGVSQIFNNFNVKPPTYGQVGNVALSIPQGVARAGFTVGRTIGNPQAKPYQPTPGIQQTFLGNEPIQTIPKLATQNAQQLKNFGINKNIASPLAGIGTVAGLSLDATPFGIPEKGGVKVAGKLGVEGMQALISKYKSVGIKGLSIQEIKNLSSIPLTTLRKLGESNLGVLQEESQRAAGKGFLANLDDAIRTKNYDLARSIMQDVQNAPKGSIKAQYAPQMEKYIQRLPKDQAGFIDFNAKIGGQQETSGTQQYLKELAGEQKQAKSIGSSGILQKGKNFLANVKSALVDSASPIEDAVSLAEKKNNFQVRPTNDIRLQIDRVLRSKSLASQFAEDNGLVNVIKKAPDLPTLDQYMIAKHTASVGTTTGRNAARDAQLVKDLAPQYDGLAQQVNQYSRKLLDYSVQSGLIPQDLATKLAQKYPDYVPINRIFNELETKGYQGSGRAIASLSKQTVVQGLKGSERAIQSPIESLLLKTQDAFTQGEKNIAAKQLASYKDLPGMKGLIQEVPKGQNAPTHGFSYLDNGVKRMFQTTPEIAAAAKSLDAQQMNIVTKILSYPTRALQLGATGLNAPFTVTNLVKDQIDAFINSNRATKTSLINPTNFVEALFSSVTHNEGYKEVVRNAGMGTSFDISREAPNLAVKQIRAGKNLSSKIKYTVTNPGELLRTLENTIGRTEELTRIQQYKGQYQALIKEGRTPQDARLLAAQAARNNTANFARSGNIGKVINYVIPFFNASFQGTRSFIRAAKQNPIQTGAKLTTSLFLPMAATTLWNTSDPARNKIYQDIQESDKEKNLIIIPDGATKDASGNYGVIKIPLPPALSSLTNLVRRGIEQSQGGNPVQAKEVFDSLFAAATPFDSSTPTKLAGSLVPQAVKPLVETATNTNLYTGNKIIPDSMKNLPPDQQVKPNTSPIARIIGGAIGQSPLNVQDFANTALGGVGSQLLGKNPLTQLQGRFAQAYGGGQEQAQFNDINKYQQEEAVTSERQKTAITNVASILMNPNEDTAKKVTIINAIKQNPTLYTALKNEIRDKSTGVTAADKAVRALSTVERAKYIKQQIINASVNEKIQLIQGFAKKGILTKAVMEELKKQLAPQK